MNIIVVALKKVENKINQINHIDRSIDDFVNYRIKNLFFKIKTESQRNKKSIKECKEDEHEIPSFSPFAFIRKDELIRNLKSFPEFITA